MYQIKFYDPKTIAKRFLKLSGSRTRWSKEELDVEQYESYILVKGDKPRQIFEEKEERKKVIITLSDDLVEVFEGSEIFHNAFYFGEIPAWGEIVAKQDCYTLETTLSPRLQKQYSLVKRQKEYRYLAPYWPLNYFSFRTDLIALGRAKDKETFTFHNTNNMPTVPLTKVKKRGLVTSYFPFSPNREL